MNIFIVFSLSILTLDCVCGDEPKIMSVMEGDSVTLHSGVVKQKDDVIVWLYGPENTLIAKTNGKPGSTKYYDEDGRFKNRVSLNYQTGSLTITNIGTHHTGLYTVKISNSKISYKTFNVTVYGVFGDTGDVMSVSVMEGDSVTLYTDVVKQKDDVIVWSYGPQDTLVAKTNGKVGSTKLYDGENGRYRDRLTLDNRTGDLTFTHMKTEYTGLYQLKLTINNKIAYKKYNVTVHARLPIPVISRNSSGCSSSSDKCVVLCSVCDVSDVSLSWYKGMSLLSSISVSDLNIRLSLHLEVEYQDTDTYTCVINNTITNTTQHLHITQLCHKCADSPSLRILMISLVFVLLTLVIMTLVICGYTHKRAVNLLTALDAKVPLTDEERSSNSSITSEYTTSLLPKQPTRNAFIQNDLQNYTVISHHCRLIGGKMSSATQQSSSADSEIQTNNLLITKSALLPPEHN